MKSNFCRTPLDDDVPMTQRLCTGSKEQSLNNLFLPTDQLLGSTRLRQNQFKWQKIECHAIGGDSTRSCKLQQRDFNICRLVSPGTPLETRWKPASRSNKFPRRLIDKYEESVAGDPRGLFALSITGLIRPRAMGAFSTRLCLSSTEGLLVRVPQFPLARGERF